jgi:hypothetical protein
VSLSEAWSPKLELRQEQGEQHSAEDHRTGETMKATFLRQLRSCLVPLDRHVVLVVARWAEAQNEKRWSSPRGCFENKGMLRGGIVEMNREYDEETK